MYAWSVTTGWGLVEIVTEIDMARLAIGLVLGRRVVVVSEMGGVFVVGRLVNEVITAGRLDEVDGNVESRGVVELSTDVTIRGVDVKADRVVLIKLVDGN